MNITSLLITLAGIFFIIALYIISRISQSKLPKDSEAKLPNLTDEEGTRFTSVLDDIPASDGSTPTPDNIVSQNEGMENNITQDSHSDNSNAENKASKASQTETNHAKNKNEVADDSSEANDSDQTNDDSDPSNFKPQQQQHILFITGRDDKQLDGSLVQQALKKNGLVLADMDIYHYFPVMKDAFPESEKYSLFRVANGVAPWTLKPEDLYGKKLAGLSIVMLTPTKINDSEAISLFIALSEKISKQIGGVLKNQQQQIFTSKDKKYLLSLYKN